MPQTKHGIFSKDLPTRLAANFEAALADPNLLALRDDIALIATRLADLLSRVDTGEAGALWRKAQTLMSELRATDDAVKQNDLLIELERTISDGVSDYAAWDEVTKLVAHRQKLVEGERKRLVELQQVITTEKAMLLIAAISDSIRRHVTDPTTLAAISADLARLTARDAGHIIDVGGG